jgi:hypothetical protein
VDQTTVQLKRTSGYQPVQIGPDTLSFSSGQLGTRYIQVNVGYNERQGIFFKKIDDNYNIVSTTWSTGITLFSNELRINTTAGIQTLEQFYLNSVADIGQVLLSAAKEKKVPAFDGLVPNTPVLADTNFKVVQINTQLTAGTSVQTLNEKVSAKTSLQSEINQLDVAIANAKAEANSVTGTATSTQNLTVVSSDSILARIDSLTGQRVQKQQLLSSLVQDISTLSQTTPGIYETPKYRVRGFWPIPEPIVSPKTGPQQVIQFSG